MLRPLEMVLAVVVVDADVTHLLVLVLQPVALSQVVVVRVVVVHIWVGVILESLSKLNVDLLLPLHLRECVCLVVWIY